MDQHKRQYFAPAEFATIIGVPTRTIDRWAAEGVLKPAVNIPGKGGRLLFTAVDVLAVFVARDLRQRGFPVAEAGEVLQALHGRELAELERDWIAGRTHLVVIAGRVSPSLFRPDAIDAGTLQQFTAAGHRVAVIDLAAAFARINAALSQREGAPAK